MMADINAKDTFFYSHKADITITYQKACEVNKDRADKIMKSNGSLIDKITQLEDMLTGEE